MPRENPSSSFNSRNSSPTSGLRQRLARRERAQEWSSHSRSQGSFAPNRLLTEPRRLQGFSDTTHANLSGSDLIWLVLHRLSDVLSYLRPTTLLNLLWRSYTFLLWHALPAVTSVLYPRRRRLLAWVRSQVPSREIADLAVVWRDGTLLCALVEASVAPTTPRLDCRSDKYRGGCVPTLRLGQKLALEYLKVAPEFQEHELCLPASPVIVSRLTDYLSSLRVAAARLKDANMAGEADLLYQQQNLSTSTQFSARGMGLLMAMQGRRATFGIFPCGRRHLFTIYGDSLLVQIRGVNGDQGSVIIRSSGAQAHHRLSVQGIGAHPLIPVHAFVSLESARVTYVPPSCGRYEISIQHCGLQIPRSPHILTVEPCSSDPATFFHPADIDIELAALPKPAKITRIVDFITEKKILTDDGQLVALPQSHTTFCKQLSFRKRIKHVTAKRKIIGKKKTTNNFQEGGGDSTFSRMLRSEAQKHRKSPSYIDADDFTTWCNEILLTCDQLLEKTERRQGLKILKTADKILNKNTLQVNDEELRDISSSPLSELAICRLRGHLYSNNTSTGLNHLEFSVQETAGPKERVFTLENKIMEQRSKQKDEPDLRDVSELAPAQNKEAIRKSNEVDKIGTAALKNFDSLMQATSVEQALSYFQECLQDESSSASPSVHEPQDEGEVQEWMGPAEQEIWKGELSWYKNPADGNSDVEESEEPLRQSDIVDLQGDLEEVWVNLEVEVKQKEEEESSESALAVQSREFSEQLGGAEIYFTGNLPACLIPFLEGTVWKTEEGETICDQMAFCIMDSCDEESLNSETIELSSSSSSSNLSVYQVAELPESARGPESPIWGLLSQTKVENDDIEIVETKPRLSVSLRHSSSSDDEDEKYRLTKTESKSASEVHRGDDEQIEIVETTRRRSITLKHPSISSDEEMGLEDFIQSKQITRIEVPQFPLTRSSSPRSNLSSCQLIIIPNEPIPRETSPISQVLNSPLSPVKVFALDSPQFAILPEFVDLTSPVLVRSVVDCSVQTGDSLKALFYEDKSTEIEDAEELFNFRMRQWANCLDTSKKDMKDEGTQVDISPVISCPVTMETGIQAFENLTGAFPVNFGTQTDSPPPSEQLRVSSVNENFKDDLVFSALSEIHERNSMKTKSGNLIYLGTGEAGENSPLPQMSPEDICFDLIKVEENRLSPLNSPVTCVETTTSFDIPLYVNTSHSSIAVLANTNNTNQTSVFGKQDVFDTPEPRDGENKYLLQPSPTSETFEVTAEHGKVKSGDVSECESITLVEHKLSCLDQSNASSPTEGLVMKQKEFWDQKLTNPCSPTEKLVRKQKQFWDSKLSSVDFLDACTTPKFIKSKSIGDTPKPLVIGTQGLVAKSLENINKLRLEDPYERGQLGRPKRILKKFTFDINYDDDSRSQSVPMIATELIGNNRVKNIKDLFKSNPDIATTFPPDRLPPPKAPEKIFVATLEPELKFTSVNAKLSLFESKTQETARSVQSPTKTLKFDVSKSSELNYPVIKPKPMSIRAIRESRQEPLTAVRKFIGTHSQHSESTSGMEEQVPAANETFLLRRGSVERKREANIEANFKQTRLLFESCEKPHDAIVTSDPPEEESSETSGQSLGSSSTFTQRYMKLCFDNSITEVLAQDANNDSSSRDEYFDSRSGLSLAMSETEGHPEEVKVTEDREVTKVEKKVEFNQDVKEISQTSVKAKKCKLEQITKRGTEGKEETAPLSTPESAYHTVHYTTTTTMPHVSPPTPPRHRHKSLVRGEGRKKSIDCHLRSRSLSDPVDDVQSDISASLSIETHTINPLCGLHGPPQQPVKPDLDPIESRGRFEQAKNFFKRLEHSIQNGKEEVIPHCRPNGRKRRKSSSDEMSCYEKTIKFSSERQTKVTERLNVKTFFRDIVEKSVTDNCGVVQPSAVVAALNSAVQEACTKCSGKNSEAIKEVPAEAKPTLRPILKELKEPEKLKTASRKLYRTFSQRTTAEMF